MKERFVKVWQGLGARGDPGPEFERLDIKYRDPNRVYHTWDHIAHCLAESDSARMLFVDPDLASLAIFYHDAVYETSAKPGDNEDRSAILAQKVCFEAGLSSDRCSALGRYIRATRHDSIPDDEDCRLIMDIDLAIFGQQAGLFDSYERAIRKEYWFVPLDDYCAHRAAILKDFNDKRPIYLTSFFRERYEGKAHKNLDRSIHLLGDRVLV
ncbi:MAG: hypothetical protein AABX47_08970 [Nanoarchaeota archaeon]